MINIFRFKRLVVCSAYQFLICWFLSFHSLFAATKIWTGGGTDPNWNTPANWMGGMVPADGDELQFPNSARYITNNDFPSLTIPTLVIDSASNYTLTGNAITFTATTGKIDITTANGNGAHTINNPLILSTGFTVSQASTGALTLGGNITGASTILYEGTASNTVILSGTGNTYSTGSSLADAILQAGVANAFPPTGTILVGTTMPSATSAVLDLNNFNQTIGSFSSALAASQILLGTATLTIQDNSSQTFAGVISGAGGLTFQNTGGTLTLSNHNTFTGTTEGKSGTLTMDIENALVGPLALSGAAAIVNLNGKNQVIGNLSGIAGSQIQLNGAQLTVTSTSNTTFSGNLVGPSGSFIKTGPASLTLAGTNNYTGGTTVSAGQLIVSTTSLSGDCLNNAALSFNQGMIGTYSGAISGSGSLSIDGVGGHVTLSGVNSFTGGLSINAGILSVMNDGALGAPSGNLAIGSATLETTASFSSMRNFTLIGNSIFDPQANTYTISGAVSGSGSLIKNSAGTLILSGANSYSGGTTINAGTLEINASNLPGNISNSGILIFNQTINGVFSGSMSGAGQLIKQGALALSVTGSSPAFTGPTSLSAGELNVTGSLANSTVTVSSGATLSGTGTVGTVFNSGTISPGNSIGTLLINGMLTLNPSSNFLVEIEPGGLSDRVVVSGTAMLDGTLTVVPQNGFYGLTRTYTILTSSLDAGMFTPPPIVTNPNYQITVVYGPNFVQLNLESLQPFLNFPAENGNIRRVAENLDALTQSGAIFSNPALVAAVNAMPNDLAGVNDALDRLHPAIMSAYEELQVELGAKLLSLFHKPTSCYCCCNRFRLWSEPFGNWFEEKNLGEQVGFFARTLGVVVGFDAQLFDHWVLGVGGGWNETDLTWEKNRGSGRTNDWLAAFYTDYLLDHFYLGATFIAGREQLHTSRLIEFTTIHSEAHSNVPVWNLMGQLATAVFIGFPCSNVFPYLNVDFFSYRASAYQESGAEGLDLVVSAHNNTTLRTEAGIGGQFQDLNNSKTMSISPMIKVGWAMECPLSRPHYRVVFAGETIPFDIRGWDTVWQLFTFDVGIKFAYKCFSLTGNYQGEISPGDASAFRASQGAIRLDFNW